jgi:hypothetical protein
MKTESFGFSNGFFEPGLKILARVDIAGSSRPLSAFTIAIHRLL